MTPHQPRIRSRTLARIACVIAPVAVLAAGGDVPAAQPGGKALPRVEFVGLTFGPAQPSLDYCGGGSINTIAPDGSVAALAIGERTTLTVVARAVDPDGDPVRIAVGPETSSLPGFVAPPLFTPDSSRVTLTFAPPAGTVADEPCEEQGRLVLTARERTAAADSQRAEVPFLVVWEGPDFALSLRYAGTVVGQQSILRWTGNLRSVGPHPIPDFVDSLYTIDFWIEDPDGLRVTTRPPLTLTGNELAFGFTFPELQIVAAKPGSHCARIVLVAGRDLDASNDSAVDCEDVAPMPVRVVPNVATPNGDGYNDAVQFFVADTGAERPRVRIFDLAGRFVFETDEVVSGGRLRWSGVDAAGVSVPAGSYLYVVDDSGRVLAKGTCGVLR